MSVQVLAQLSELARRQEIHYEMGPARALAWRVVAKQQPDIRSLANTMYQRLVQQEQLNVRRLDIMYTLMAEAAKQGEAMQHYIMVQYCVTSMVHVRLERVWFLD